MIRKKLTKIMILIPLIMCFGFMRDLSAQDRPGRVIQIDIPVVLEKANVVFNMAHLTFDGDMPVGIKI